MCKYLSPVPGTWYVPGTEIWLKLALAVASNELREEVLQAVLRSA